MPSVYTFNALVRTAVLYARGLANNWFCRVLSVGTVESLARHRQPDNRPGVEPRTVMGSRLFVFGTRRSLHESRSARGRV